MTTLQIILIALFIYLGSIGSIVGNTIGWYTLGRPLVAAFIVGLIMQDVQSAMIVGIALQIMYMGLPAVRSHGIFPTPPTSERPVHWCSARGWIPRS